MIPWRSSLLLALRDGVLAGALLGLVHAGTLSRAGLYATAPAHRIVASVLRWAGLLGVVGGAVAMLATALWLGVARWRRRTRPRAGLRPLRAGWLAPAAYAALWTLMLAHGGWTRPQARGGLFAAALAAGTAASVMLVLAVAPRRRPQPDVRHRKRGAGRWLGTWAPVLGAAVCLVSPRWLPPPTPDAPDGELRRLPSTRLEAAAEAGFTGRRRNLLLITIDTLRADHVGCYGYGRSTTPAIDALAHRGVRVEQALCPRPTTSPSFATFFTGLYPIQHGVHFTLQTLSASNLTLAEILHADGYATAAVITNANLFPVFGFDQGFDTYVYGHVRADEGAQRTLDWLQHQLPVDRPWFLWFHSTDPHAPYNPLPPYDTMFQPAGEGDGVARQAALYDGEIRFTDDQIARVLAFFYERPRLLESTLIVFTADHGESLGEHDYYFQHGELPYEQTAHIPLVFVAPGGLPAGTSCPALVTGADLLPTLLSALGLTIPAHVQGNSCLPALLGLDADGPNPFVFLEAGFGDHIRLGRTRTLRRPGYKYVQRLTRWARLPDSPAGLPWSMNALLEGSLQPDEVYDLAADPDELHNLFGQDSARDARERRLLEAFARRLARSRRLPEGAKAHPDPATLEELRTLGYVE